MAETSTSLWSDIPLELAGLVLLRLSAHADRVRSAAVCCRWRDAAREIPLPPPLPLLALPDGTVYSLPGTEPFHIPSCEGYNNACGNWLFFSHEDRCFLRDPFSDATVILPALSRIRFQYTKLDSRWVKIQNDKILAVHQVKFCSPQLIVAVVSHPVFSGPGIAVCQPGAFSWWIVHLDERYSKFGDIIFHQGKLYALHHSKGDLFSIDISIDHNTGDPWVSQVQQVINGSMDQSHISTPHYAIIMLHYMVELRGRLLMVQRFMYRRRKKLRSPKMVSRSWRNEFEVFEGDLERSQWSRVTSIGDDQVLFLQRQCCKFVSVSQYEVQGDRIFFLEDGDDDDEDDLRNGEWDDYDEERLGPCRVFDMRDGRVSDSLPTVSWKRNPTHPTWLFPQGQE